MILEESSTERSALHALEMLEPPEAERFEREARLDPDLAACTAEFRDVAASVAVGSCDKMEPPPLTVLTGALERIGAVGSKKPAPVASNVSRFGNWPVLLAACAAVALLAGGGVSLLMNKLGEGRDDRTGAAAAGGAAKGDEGTVVIMRNGEPVATIDASDRVVTDLLVKLERMQKLRAAPGIIQDVARLKRELESLRKADAERFAAGPRVARTVYIEMVEPGTEAEDDEALSERVSEYIATAIELDVGVAEAGNSTPVDPGGGKDPIVYIPDESGALPDLNDVGDTPFFYKDFPVGDDRFESIDPGRVWDSDNGRIWVETEEPGLYQAVAPPQGFDPDFIEDYAGIIPLAGSIPAPPTTAGSDEPEPGERRARQERPEEDTGPADPTVAANAPPVAVTIYEETTGEGFVVLSNLKPAEEGQAYQLWMRNAADDQVVSVGMLPELKEGTERVEFDLLGPGITPAGFFLTLEPEGGVDSPSENIILQGP